MTISKILDHDVIPLHNVNLAFRPTVFWYKCINCNLEIYHSDRDNQFKFYKNGWESNKPVVKLDITCGEQIIKNILE